MRITLASIGSPDNPFVYAPAQVVEVPDRPSLPAGSFKLVHVDNLLPDTAPARPDPGDCFSAFGGGSCSPLSLASLQEKHRFEGAFKLVSAAKINDGNFWGEPGLGKERDAVFTKGADSEFHKFAQFTKVQETGDGNVEVWGVATHEKPDLDGEVCEYDSAKRAYQDWSTAAVARTSAAGQQISLGPIRYQHSTEPAGKATKIEYNDDAKEIWLGSIPINDEIRQQLQDGYLTGYSQGGSYAWRRCADCNKALSLQQGNNYCPDCKKTVPVVFGLKRVAEVSYVDSPCTGKGFQYVKSDGSSKFVTFTKRVTSPDHFRILDSTRISKKLWKHTVNVGGTKRTVVSWPDGALLA